MKKIAFVLGLALFSVSSYANDNKATNVTSIEKKEVAVKKVSKEEKESKEVDALACTPSSYKVFHRVNCGHFSWYTVDWVDTVVTTCVNGVAVRNVYHWEQSESLLCS